MEIADVVVEIADAVVEIAGGVVAMEIAGVVVMEIAGVIVVVAGRSQAKQWQQISQGAVVRSRARRSQIANEAGSGNRRRGCSSRRNLAGTLSLGLQGWCMMGMKQIMEPKNEESPLGGALNFGSDEGSSGRLRRCT